MVPSEDPEKCETLRFSSQTSWWAQVLWIFLYHLQLYKLCFMYFGSLLLSAHTFSIVVFLLSWPLYRCVMSSTFRVIFLVLKPTLSDIYIAAPTNFWLEFTWYIFSHPFALNLSYVFIFKVGSSNVCIPRGKGIRWEELGDWDWHTYTTDTMYKIDNW